MNQGTETRHVHPPEQVTHGRQHADLTRGRVGTVHLRYDQIDKSFVRFRLGLCAPGRVRIRSHGSRERVREGIGCIALCLEWVLRRRCRV